MDLRGNSLRRLISFCCALSFSLWGYDAGVLGGVQDTKPFHQAIGHPTGAWTIPMISSSYSLAAGVASLAVVFCGFHLGRKRCVMLGNASVVVGGLLQSTAFSVPHMIVGRIFTGFGIGFISSTVPTYISEMGLEKNDRGPAGAYQSIVLIGGVSLSYWVDLGFTRLHSQVSWRVPIALQCIFAGLSLSIMFFLPDTARWYYAKGHIERGDRTLARLNDTSIDDPVVQRHKAEIQASIQMEWEESSSFEWRSLLWDNTRLKAGRRIRISFLILGIQQLMGINLLVYYATTIFGQVGLSSFLSQLLAAVLSLSFAAGTVPLPWTIERWGRRPIMMWSAVACTVLMAIFLAMIGLPEHRKTLATQWTAVGIITVWIFVFGYGWIAVPWFYGPEIAPLKYRHIGGAAGATAEWFGSFVTVFGGGVALENIGWKIWIWQLVSCAVAVAFVYFMCPETTGKSLEEIDLLFTDGNIEQESDTEKSTTHADFKHADFMHAT